MSSTASSSRRSGSMTKEQLKSALVANRVPLPPGSAKKEEYQRLYDQKVVSNQAVGDFSSDEEAENVEPEAEALEHEALEHVDNGGGVELVEVDQMTNEQLYEACCEAFGKDHVGPVMDNTRSLYMKKLDNYLFPDRANGSENGFDIPAFVGPVADSNGPPANGHSNTFSDSDDDLEELEDIVSRRQPSSGRGSSRGSTASSVAISSISTNSVSTRGKRRSVSPVSEDDAVENVGRISESRVQRSNKRLRSVETADIGVGPLPPVGQQISYFKERPGYPNFTTSNSLPFKPFANRNRGIVVNAKPTEPKKPSPWTGAYALVALLGMLGAILYYYYTNGMGGGEAAIQQKQQEDELDEILNAIQDEEMN